jgi:Rrf2 family iron-sulfur cluster assembly transcriptional regulator
MKISSKSRYATIAMLDIATRAAKGPVTLADISKNQDISISYLEQIFAKLRRTGLVTAARGPGGGYKLSRPAEAITLAQIIDTFNDDRYDNMDASDTADQDKDFTARLMWSKLSENLHTYLEGMTLAECTHQSPTQTMSMQ